MGKRNEILRVDIDENVSHFFDSIERIKQRDYIPSEQVCVCIYSDYSHICRDS